MIGVTWILLAAVIVIASLYSRWRHRYWSSRGFPSAPGLPFLGSLHKLFSWKHNRYVFDTEVYTKYGGSRMCGFYEMFRPVLMVGEPDLIKQILVKDFDHFSDRRSIKFSNDSEDISNHMLTNLNGDMWKTTRSIMTPTFTSGKMKGMFHLVSKKADDLVAFCLSEAVKKPHLEMKRNYGRYTLDTIATCAFGIECNSLVNEDCVFPKKAAVFFESSFRQLIRFMVLFTCPYIFTLFRLRINPPEMDFFQQVMKETLAARRKNEPRGDFLDLLLEARDEHKTTTGSSDEVMPDESILAQSVLFLIVGYDTTASTLAFSSYLLSKHPEVQHRLRQELHDMLEEHGDLTYQGIMEAKFLDGCILETLRLFPPLVSSERVCTKQFTFSGTDLVIEPGTIVQYPIWCLHHDAKYWPEPDKFRPDRFLPENKANIKSFTHMPFGMGPRNCIAMRFALMEAKVALAKMVLSFEMSLAPGHEDLKLTSGPNIMGPANGVHLILSPLKEE